ncbi:MAG: hypothetical protein Q7S58_05600 [Candidatus Binatus sp.]|uniref:hypothetical protein n=1 Tax=Candidatus Binatus sp. TaxID=2811406 RepID=UPI00272267A0|nr:hypothetical protein [Candidatus Binatus sp.]MDO8431870.1 hypothetical protein [Candidatus Binatus sp.]
MAAKLRVLLVDFIPGGVCLQTQDAVNKLSLITGALGDRYEFHRTATAWNGGNAPLELNNADIVFINANYSDLESSSLHTNEHRNLQRLLKNGSAVFVFVGNSRPFHIENLTGVHIALSPSENSPTSCKLQGETPLESLFAKLGNRIAIAPRITNCDPSWSVFLKSPSGHSTGFFVPFDSGRCTFLPSFGNSVPEAVEEILTNVLPVFCPHLVYDDKFKWLEEPTFLMPSLAELRFKREKARQDYEAADTDLKAKYDLERTNVQEQWNQLLASSGRELERAIQRALEFFGFRVTDVDQLLKLKGVSTHEEDLWVADGFEPDPSVAGLLITEIKSSERGTTKEDDYSQLVKYMNRRKTEYKNSELRGLLVINHAYAVPANIRPKAFSEAVVRDSLSDRICLATTWDLFRLGQNLLARTISSDQIRVLFKSDGELRL